MVVIGLVDHGWTTRLQLAAREDPPTRVAGVLAEHGFATTDALVDALVNLNWEEILAVAKAFDPNLGPEIIC
jgi:hypothetical protein